MKKICILLSIFLGVFLFVIKIPYVKAAAAERTADNGIPVIYIDIDESKGTISDMNSSPQHTAECYGSISIVVPDDYKCEYAEEVKSIENLELDYIRGRGTSTWLIPDKKPYKLKLKNSTDLFGMGKNKHWVLLANAMDPTFLRNKITYWLGEKLGMDYTMKSVPVEVVMNGEYIGFYFLTEHVRVGKTRIDIEELTEDVSSESNITGGYLLSMDPFDIDGNDNEFCTTRDVSFQFENPDFIEYKNTSQRNYICNYLQNTENAIFGEGFKDKNGISYKEYMDVASAVDFWWVQQICLNQDAYLTDSTYLYKKENDKLYWGPLWDFDVTTWGDYSNNLSDLEGFGPSTIWLDKLKEDSEFLDLIRARWSDIDPILDEMIREGGAIDTYYNEIKAAVERDRAKWGSYGQLSSYAYEIDFLKTWIGYRRQWINDNLDAVKEFVPSYEYLWVDGTWYGIYGQADYEPKGKWINTDKGTSYVDTSGWKAEGVWEKIDFTWYYFDDDGYMAEDEWRDGYYLSPDGAYDYRFRGSWKQNSTGWWYEDESGWYPVNSWQKIDGIWYYFNEEGYWLY